MSTPRSQETESDDCSEVDQTAEPLVNQTAESPESQAPEELESQAPKLLARLKTEGQT